MSINTEKVKEMLGAGLSVSIVASALGCEHSYISQLLMEPTFQEEVTALRMLATSADYKRDATIDGIEDKLLSKLDEMVEEGAFFRPRDVLLAATTVNRMQRRAKQVGTSGPGNTVNNIVNISLPTHVARRFTTNRQNEVVAVGDQTLVTMPAHQLLSTLSSRSSSSTDEGQDNGAERYTEAAKYLPSGITSKIIDS